MTNIPRVLLPTVLTAIAVVAPACDVGVEPGHVERYIIDGDPVTGEEFGAVLGIKTNVGSICTATLISPTTILTAAHCVEPQMLQLQALLAGQTPPEVIEYQYSFARDLTGADAGEFLDVADVSWHEMFLSDPSAQLEPGIGQWNDIALLHLADPIEDRPIQQLAPTDVVEALEMDRMYAVAGYGLTDDDNNSSAGKLTAGQSGLDQIADFEILAGEGDAQQACRGDSGGPIFADDSDTYQIGIASRLASTGDTIPPPCENGLVYTRVDIYADWIEEQVAAFEMEDHEDDGNPDDDEEEDDGDGGGCSASGGSGGLGLALLFAGLLVSRRRRRR